MSGSAHPQGRVVATPAARTALARLRDACGPVMFYQSGGCCGGSAPMCFSADEFILSDRDRLLGDVDGTPMYIDARQDEAWGRPTFTLGVGAGEPEGFSLEAGPGLHFVLEAPGVSCTPASGTSATEEYNR